MHALMLSIDFRVSSCSNAVSTFVLDDDELKIEH